jgi:transcription initiation factor IIF auxiliary subunit
VKRSPSRWRVAGAALLIAPLVPGRRAVAVAQQIQVANSAVYAGSGQWDWKIYLVAPASVLDRIAYVEYTLHPSFPNPVRRVSTRGNNFALTARGWGEFNIAVKVVAKSGDVTRLLHWLTLKQGTTSVVPPIKPPATEHGLIKTENTAQRLDGQRWQWTVYLVADDRTLGDIACVEYRLHPSFPNPIRRVCTRGSGRAGFPLTAVGWGTFPIGVQVSFKDGTARYLQHTLSYPGPAK